MPRSSIYGLRQDFADSFSRALVSDPFGVSQTTYSANTWGFSIPETPVTDTVGPGYGRAWNETIDRLSDQPSSIPNPLVSSLLAGYCESSMRDPSLAQEFNTTESNLQITIRQSLEATDHQFSNILPLWDNGFENATGPGGLFDGKQAYSRQILCHVLRELVQYFNSNEDDWVAGLLDTGKYPHLNGDTTSLEGSQLEEAISYGGVYFEAGSSFTPHNHVPLTRPRNSTAPHVNREDQIANRTRETNTWKPYREILPSCRTEGQSGLLSLLLYDTSYSLSPSNWLKLF